MIVYELDPDGPADVGRARRAVLEALAPMHLIHGYASVDALRTFLDTGLSELRTAQLAGQVPAEMPIALQRCWLFYTDPSAVEVCRLLMAPGAQLEAWALPGGWVSFYERIDGLRAMARRYDPAFLPLME